MHMKWTCKDKSLFWNRWATVWEFCLQLYLLWLRYRAVASWNRVQRVGIPLFTAIEIFSIWVLSIILAVPEAVAFNMVTFTYKNQTFRTCMLEPKTDFMMVRSKPDGCHADVFSPHSHKHSNICNKQCILSVWPRCYALFLWPLTNFDPGNNILCK